MLFVISYGNIYLIRHGQFEASELRGNIQGIKIHKINRKENSQLIWLMTSAVIKLFSTNKTKKEVTCVVGFFSESPYCLMILSLHNLDYDCNHD